VDFEGVSFKTHMEKGFVSGWFCRSTVPAAGYFLSAQKVTKNAPKPRGSGPPAIHPGF
jgi:hypothetical protein